MSDLSVIGSMADAPALSSPLDALVAQHQADVEAVESIAAAVSTAPQMSYFFDAAKINAGNYHMPSVVEVFNLERAKKAIDAHYWQKAMLLTDVLEYMPAEKRNDWNDHIRTHKTPPFQFDAVKVTLVQLLNNRAKFMAERVDGLFRALSHEHVTNRPEAFGKRFIMDYMLSYGSIRWERANYIHDLRCVIGKFLGREVPKAHNTHNDLESMERDGQWNEFDGGAFRVRLYKKGTAHMEVHPDIAWQLNKVLAYLHPAAIPNEFRTPPKKKAKEYKLHDDLLSFELVSRLESGIPNRYQRDSRNTQGQFLRWSEPVSDQLRAVLEYLGGVPGEKGEWLFDYTIAPVIKEISRSGRIPEQKSHQFYPTPPELAEIAVGLAEIGPDDECLEPSAGMGGLADFMPKERTTCVEVSALHCKVLEAKGYLTHCWDFLYTKGRIFDRIVMNPPFSEGRAVGHVQHAATILRNGGRLVAIMPASNKGKTIVQGMRHEWSEIYSGMFKDASVSVVILTLTRGEQS